MIKYSKTRIIIWITSILIALIIFRKESLFYSIPVLVAITSIFLINLPRSKIKLDYFLDIADCLRKYLFPAFALISAWIIFVGSKMTIDGPWIIFIWYILFFIFYNMIIIIPSFYIISKNPKTVFGRVYLVLAIFMIGYMSSSLSGGLAGLTFIKNFGWTPELDKTIFYLFSCIETWIGIILIWKYFMIKNNANA